MSKAIQKFALAASVSLAMAFTFSCSGGDDGPDNNPVGNVNLSDLPEGAKQVWLVEMDYDDDDNLVVLSKEEYRDGGIVFLSPLKSQSCSGSCVGNGCELEYECECTNRDGDVFECERDYEYNNPIPSGKIQDGLLLLNLPTIDTKYLGKMEPRNNEYCQSDVIAVPKSILADDISLYVKDISSGKRDCRIRPYLIESGGTNRAEFIYFSESGKATGTETCTYTNTYNNRIEIDTHKEEYDLHFSRGWNLCFNYCDGDHCSGSSGGGDNACPPGEDCNEPSLPPLTIHTNYLLTTNFPKDAKLEFWIICYDD